MDFSSCLSFFFFPSKSILTEGEKVSSYCPLFMAHIKAPRKLPATITLKAISNRITDIFLELSFYNLLRRAYKLLMPTAKPTTEIELTGISMAANTGESCPETAQLIPMKL